MTTQDPGSRADYAAPDGGSLASHSVLGAREVDVGELLRRAVSIRHAEHSTTGWATIAKGRCPEDDPICNRTREVLAKLARLRARDALVGELGGELHHLHIVDLADRSDQQQHYQRVLAWDYSTITCATCDVLTRVRETEAQR